jgi:hypothetical protein
MNKIKKNLYMLLILSVFFISSCATWNTKDLSDLKQKTFYLQKFNYSKKGLNKKTAIDRMGKFPTEQILKILAHKCDITIDSSEFENFILSGNTSEMQAKGLFIDVEFIWENKNKHANTIEIEYENLPPSKGNVMDNIEKFTISLKINGKNKVVFMKNIDKTQILVTIAEEMGYSRQNKDSDDYYINKENKSIVDLTAIELKEKKITVKKNLEVKFKQEIKDYMNTLPKEEKIKFRDTFVKFLYTIE